MMKNKTIQRVLYTAIGDTDPVRDFRDGSMLHIVRHYCPDLVVLFLSKEMAKRETDDNRYTKAIKYVYPNCLVELYETDLVEVHRLDGLNDMLECFQKIRNAHPKAEILLNYSSGTPQMKTLMALLATDYENAIGIQVDSPQRGSNSQVEHAAQADDIEVQLALNEDAKEQAPNRCTEPQLKPLRRYVYKNQIESLILKYEYRGALAIYKKNKELFSEDVGRLLEHAIYRESLCYNDAIMVIRAYNGIKFTLNTERKKEIQLHEYLSLIQLRQIRKEFSEMIVKITPFLYELLLYYIVDKKHYTNIFTKKKSKFIIERNHLKAHYPHILKALDKEFNMFKDGTDVSFKNALVVLKAIDDLSDKALIESLEVFSDIGKDLRNLAAHIITEMSEQMIRNKTGLDSSSLVHCLRDALFLVIDSEYKQRRFMFDTINDSIKDALNIFKRI